MGVFGATVFAARTLDRVLDGDVALRQVAASFALAASIVAAGIGASLFFPLSAQAWQNFFAIAEINSQWIRIAQVDWGVAVLRGLILFALLTALRKPTARWFAGALLFLCADLGPVVHELNPRMASEYFTATPEIVRTLPPNRSDYRIFHLADWQIGDEIGHADRRGEARYRIIRNGLFPMTPAAYGIQTVLERDYDETTLLPTDDLTRSMWDVRSSGRPDWMLPFGAMSNAWFLAVPRSADATDFAERPVEFLEGRRHPRYYFAEKLITIADRREFVALLSRGAHPDRVAFIAAPSFNPAPGTIVSLHERANTASIEVVTEGRAFLVMSVTPHKYWRVTIDGEKADPIITNIGYQGVVVEAGLHQIEMVYRNGIILTGAAISLISVLLAGLAFSFTEGRSALA
jgi:hypothetical protein